jgi:DNA-binding SARP family transcriptional activator
VEDGVAEELLAGLPAGRTRGDLCRVTVLGDFRITWHGRTLQTPMGAQRLIALLSVKGRLHRERVAGTLWPESDCLKASHSLRTELWQVGRHCPGLLAVTHDAVEIADHVEVDLQRLGDRARALAEDPTDLDLVDLLAPMSETELLPGWGDEWVMLEREHVRQRQLHCLEDCARELVRRGKHSAALANALTALRIEPLRESSHRLAIEIHLSEGNLGEALAHYRRTTSLLADELGVAPSAVLRDMMRPHVPRQRLEPDLG